MHHCNEGNPLRLVDDLMEPFRPLTDLAVFHLMRQGRDDVTPETKKTLARVLYHDMPSDAGATPVMVCMQKLATSLAQVLMGERGKLDLPLPGLPLQLNSEI